MPVIDAVALTQRIIVLEAAVTSGNAREAEQDRWIAELEELTTLSFEVVTLRKRPRLPEPPASNSWSGRSVPTSETGTRRHAPAPGPPARCPR